MYHVKTDKRSLKSAEFIYHALRTILEDKPINSISISDIANESQVSRMTFYRLFDSITDVLSWKLSVFVSEYEKFRETMSDKLLAFFTFWKGHIDFIYLISKNCKYILNEAFSTNKDLNNTYDYYLNDIQVSIMSSLLSLWSLRNGKDTPEEMAKMTAEFFKRRTELLEISKNKK
ncbi:MAG: TetR/AcrR family transcriptional regulator [Acholeplasmatales bacterium]|jgi:AcrR family transcriptional regulator|nr:TetR/AcrR family transcriptional regulator [Acholeplasmatales bacterium]